MNIQKIIFVILCLEVFLVPLFFLPFTSDVLDLNKEFLFIGLTSAAVVLWFSQGLKTKKFKITYIPLFLLAPGFLLFYTLSTIFSKARNLSFLGSVQGGVSPSWFGLLFLVIFYFLLINHIKTARHLKILVSVFVFSGLVSLALFTLNVFGQSFWPWDFAKLSSFNTAGSISNLAIFLGLALVMALALFLDKPSDKKQVSRGSSKRFLRDRHSIIGYVYRGLLLVFIFAGLLGLQIINFKAVWLVLMAVSFVFLVLVLSFYHYLNLRISWMWLVVLFFMLAIASYFWDLPALYDVRLPAEISLSPRLSRTIALKTTLSSTKNFILGAGPSTFQYSFSQFRPESFNQNLIWQWRFNKPGGYIWEVLATSGWLGLASLGILILFLLIASFFILLRLPRVAKPDQVSQSRGPAKTSASGSLAHLTSFWSARQRFVSGGDPCGRPSRAGTKFVPYSVRGPVPTTDNPIKPGTIKQDNSQVVVLISLLSGFIGLILGLMTLTPAFMTVFMFWLVAGLMSVSLIVASPQRIREIGFSFQASPKHALIVSFLSVLMFSFVAFLVIGGLRIYLAAVYTKQAVDNFSAVTLDELGSPNRFNKLSQAEAAIKKSLNLDKKQPQYLMLAAHIAFNQAVEEVLKPEDQRDLQLATNYLALAVNQSKRATDLAPNDVSLWVQRASLLRSALGFTQQVREWAVKSYETGLSLEPTNPWFSSQLGLLYYDQGRAKENQSADIALLTKSQENLERALQLKLNFIEARLALVNVFEDLGQTLQAIQILEQGLEAGTSASARLFYELGRLQYNQFVSLSIDEAEMSQALDWLNSAAVNFEKAAALNTSYANALYSLSLACEKQAKFGIGTAEQKLRQAITLTEKVLSLNPERADLQERVRLLNSQL